MTDPYCFICDRVHQPRERAVPCRVCHRPTLDVHARCPKHAMSIANQEAIREDAEWDARLEAQGDWDDAA